MSNFIERSGYRIYAKLTEDEGGATSTAPVTSAGSSVAGQSIPLAMTRRNWKQYETFAGSTVFEVDPKTYQKCKEAKARYQRWSDYIDEDDGETGKTILAHAKTYPNKGILLKEKGTGAMVFLKNTFGKK